MEKISDVDIEKFWSRIDKRGESDCWPWLAGNNGVGYGVMYVKQRKGRKAVLAHRLSLALATGLMPKAFALHSCDNPGCCNPRHLRWGTQKENMGDAKTRGRASPPPIHYGPAPHRNMPKGEANPSSKLTNEGVAEIYRMRLAGAGNTTIAKKMGLDPSTVLDIIRGTHWGHRLGVDGNPTLPELDAVKGNERPAAKITPEVAREIKAAFAAGETGRSIAARYGLHFGSVSDIKRGLTWRDA